MEFIHRYEPGSGRALVMLHGTGGDENDLLPLARTLDPKATVLSPRGKVLENGMPRFFRRLALGVFDVEDVKARAHELADFIESFGLHEPYAVGYSNGANIAAAILLLRPRVFAGAILFRPMLPLDATADLAGVRVLICAAKRDEYSSPEQTRALQLALDGAEVTLNWVPGGHALTAEDVEVARRWLMKSVVT